MAIATNIQNCKYVKLYWFVLNFKKTNYRRDFQLFIQYHHHLHSYDFMHFDNAFL